MRQLAEAFFAQHPGVSLGVLALPDNAAVLDLLPFGVPVEVFDPAQHRELVEQYLRLNLLAFRSLPLPRWVLSDLFLLPGVIGLLLGPPARMDPAARDAARVRDGQPAILAAYVGAPTLVPGRSNGVSLIAFARGLGGGAWVKALTLKMVGARSVRGVTQWDSASLRTHTRLGPLRVVGPAPGGHELSGQSFVYECDVSDEATLAAAMSRALPPSPVRAVPPGDAEALGRILAGAQHGERHLILPPGLDAAGRVVFAA